jgi:transposase
MVSKVIGNDIALKARVALAKLKSKGSLANKLKALIAANEHGVKKVSEILNVSRTAIYRWANELDTKGLEVMTNKAKHKGGIKLKKEHREAIKGWLEESPNISIFEVKENLTKEFGLFVSKSTVHRAMGAVGFSYITPRKKHYKQNQKTMAEFKKKSAE